MTQPAKKEGPAVQAPLTGTARLASDLKRLSGLAAKFGMFMGLLCHLVPHNYRIACDAVVSACRHLKGG